MLFIVPSLVALATAAAPSPARTVAVVPDTTPAPAAAPATPATPAAQEVSPAADTSLHLDMPLAQRLSDVNKKLQETVKAHPYDSATVVKAMQDLQAQYPGLRPPPEKMLSTQVASNPELVNTLKAANFTPDSYSRSLVSLQLTWAVVEFTNQAMAQGADPSQLQGQLPPVVPANLEFVKAHVKDLLALGFSAPNVQINRGS